MQQMLVEDALSVYVQILKQCVPVAYGRYILLV